MSVYIYYIYHGELKTFALFEPFFEQVINKISGKQPPPPKKLSPYTSFIIFSSLQIDPQHEQKSCQLPNQRERRREAVVNSLKTRSQATSAGLKAFNKWRGETKNKKNYKGIFIIQLFLNTHGTDKSLHCAFTRR